MKCSMLRVLSSTGASEKAAEEKHAEAKEKLGISVEKPGAIKAPSTIRQYIKYTQFTKKYSFLFLNS